MLNVDLRSTLLTLDLVQASLTLCSLNRNVNLLTVQFLADDVILSYHISLLILLYSLYITFSLSPARATGYRQGLLATKPQNYAFTNS